MHLMIQMRRTSSSCGSSRWHRVLFATPKRNSPAFRVTGDSRVLSSLPPAASQSRPLAWRASLQVSLAGLLHSQVGDPLHRLDEGDGDFQPLSRPQSGSRKPGDTCQASLKLSQFLRRSLGVETPAHIFLSMISRCSHTFSTGTHGLRLALDRQGNHDLAPFGRLLRLRFRV